MSFDSNQKYGVISNYLLKFTNSIENTQTDFRHYHLAITFKFINCKIIFDLHHKLFKNLECFGIPNIFYCHPIYFIQSSPLTQGFYKDLKFVFFIFLVLFVSRNQIIYSQLLILLLGCKEFPLELLKGQSLPSFPKFCINSQSTYIYLYSNLTHFFLTYLNHEMIKKDAYYQS